MTDKPKCLKRIADLAAELLGYRDACDKFWKARSVWDKWEGHRTPDPNESEFSKQIRANYWGALQSAEARCNEHWRQVGELLTLLGKMNPAAVATLRFVQNGELAWHLVLLVSWDGVDGELRGIYYDATAALEKMRSDSIATAAVRRKPLGEIPALLYEHLLTLPEHKAMNGPAILEWLAKKSHVVSEDTFYKDILPVLEPYGLMNKKRIGYHIPLSERPNTIPKT